MFERAIGGGAALMSARAALARAETSVGLRTRLAEPSGEGVVALPAGLGALFPAGLPRGSVVGVAGSASLTWVLLAAAMGQAGWAAVVGQKDAGWVAAAEAGVDLARVAALPAPGSAVEEAVAACVDGFDAVVLGAGADVGAGARRSLLGRVRSHGTVLLTATPWPGAPLLRARVKETSGCTADGSGHVTERTLVVSREGSGTTVLVRMGQTAQEYGEAPRESGEVPRELAAARENGAVRRLWAVS